MTSNQILGLPNKDNWPELWDYKRFREIEAELLEKISPSKPDQREQRTLSSEATSCESDAISNSIRKRFSEERNKHWVFIKPAISLLTECLHPNPNLRIKPSEMEQHDFLQTTHVPHDRVFQIDSTEEFGAYEKSCNVYYDLFKENPDCIRSEYCNGPLDPHQMSSLLFLGVEKVRPHILDRNTSDIFICKSNLYYPYVTKVIMLQFACNLKLAGNYQ